MVDPIRTYLIVAQNPAQFEAWLSSHHEVAEARFVRCLSVLYGCSPAKHSVVYLPGWDNRQDATILKEAIDARRIPTVIL